MKVLRFEPDDVACQTCLSRLDEYVASQLVGEDYVTHFPDVAMHLDACPNCADAYARVYELTLAEAADRLPQPDHLPDPDLSFLLPGAMDSLSPAALRAGLRFKALAERLQAAFSRTGDRLTLQLSTELVQLLQPSPAVAQVRAPADAERYDKVLLTLEPDEALLPDLPVTLVAYRDAHRPELCLVEAVVEPPGRSWPELEGIVVALIVAGGRREAMTDAWGLAAFEGIHVAQLAELILEIEL